MENSKTVLSQEARLQLKRDLIAANDTLVLSVPKVELHIHIEGVLTPELRWKLANRHGIKPRLGESSREFDSAEDLRRAHEDIISSAQLPSFPGQPVSARPPTFFEAYYSGFEVLQTKEDFFDLAWNYFQQASSINVRYCEIFFDPQGHTSRGVPWANFMEGFREAQTKALKELKLPSAWIMCFLRDQSLESAKEHYEQALAYRDMIIGFGLDSNEYNHPPMLFDEVFSRARQDGFKITAHCDVGQKDTHQNIRQVASILAQTGADRIDHGLNAADRQDLVDLVKKRDIGMTICPWAYLRRESYGSVGHRIRVLLDAGIRFSIASDSLSYMDDTWITLNMLATRKMCSLTDEEVLRIARNSVEISWAPADLKKAILEEIESVSA